MTTGSMTVALDSASASERLLIAVSLVSLGHSQLGASVTDLERSNLAVSEIVELFEDRGPLRSVRVDHVSNGIDLTLTFSGPEEPPTVPTGSRQVIDAGLDQWSVDFPDVVIGLRSLRAPSRHG